MSNGSNTQSSEQTRRLADALWRKAVEGGTKAIQGMRGLSTQEWGVMGALILLCILFGWILVCMSVLTFFSALYILKAKELRTQREAHWLERCAELKRGARIVHDGSIVCAYNEDWLSVIVQRFWQTTLPTLADQVFLKLVDKLNARLPSIVKCINLEGYQLGERTPHLFNFEAQTDAETNQVVIEGDIDYLSDAVVKMNAQPTWGPLVRIRISQVSFKGKFRLTFNLPHDLKGFHAEEIFAGFTMLSQPKIDFSVETMSLGMDMIKFPGISEWLLEFAYGKVNEMLTWPRVFNIRLSRAAKEMTLDAALGYPHLGQVDPRAALVEIGLFYPNLEKYLPLRCTSLHSSHRLRQACPLAPGDPGFREEDLFVYLRYARPTVAQPAITDIMIVTDSAFSVPEGYTVVKETCTGKFPASLSCPSIQHQCYLAYSTRRSGEDIDDPARAYIPKGDWIRHVSFARIPANRPFPELPAPLSTSREELPLPGASPVLIPLAHHARTCLTTLCFNRFRGANRALLATEPIVNVSLVFSTKNEPLPYGWEALALLKNGKNGGLNFAEQTTPTQTTQMSLCYVCFQRRGAVDSTANLDPITDIIALEDGEQPPNDTYTIVAQSVTNAYPAQIRSAILGQLTNPTLLHLWVSRSPKKSPIHKLALCSYASTLTLFKWDVIKPAIDDMQVGRPRLFLCVKRASAMSLNKPANKSMTKFSTVGPEKISSASSSSAPRKALKAVGTAPLKAVNNAWEWAVTPSAPSTHKTKMSQRHADGSVSNADLNQVSRSSESSPNIEKKPSSLSTFKKVGTAPLKAVGNAWDWAVNPTASASSSEKTRSRSSQEQNTSTRSSTSTQPQLAMVPPVAAAEAPPQQSGTLPVASEASSTTGVEKADPPAPPTRRHQQSVDLSAAGIEQRQSSVPVGLTSTPNLIAPDRQSAVAEVAQPAASAVVETAHPSSIEAQSEHLSAGVVDSKHHHRHHHQQSASKTVHSKHGSNATTHGASISVSGERERPPERTRASGWLNKLTGAESAPASAASAAATTARDAKNKAVSFFKDFLDDDEAQREKERKALLRARLHITDRLVEYLQNMCSQHGEETWLNFPTDEFRASYELTDSQTQHATLVMKAAPALAKLRFRLCPSRMTENRFWQVYFELMKHQIGPLPPLE